MDIRGDVQREIDHLLQQPPTGQRAVCDVRWTTGQLTLELDEVQPLGCALWQLTVREDALASRDSAGLARLGQQLTTRVGYLLEPLQVHEIDAATAAVQVRSHPPQREAKTVRYYEALLQRDGGLRLARFEKRPGQPREQVAALVTIEVLQRLCQDVVATCQQPAAASALPPTP